MMSATNVNSTPARGRDGRPPTLFTVNVTNMSDVEAREALDVLDISEWATALESVNLSLNKKRRWDTLYYLKSDIEKQQFKEENFHVHVVERLWMNRRANCEEITSNADLKSNFGSSVFFEPDSLLYQPKPEAKHERPRVHFGRKDFRKTTKKDSKVKKKKEAKVGEVAEESADTQHPELRVEVVGPTDQCINPPTTLTSRRRRERVQRIKDAVVSRVSPYYKNLLNNSSNQHTSNSWGVNDWGDDWGSVPAQRADIERKPKPKTVPESSKPSLVQWDSDSYLTFDPAEEEEEEEEYLNACKEYVIEYALSFQDFIFSAPQKRGKRRKPKKDKTEPLSHKGKIVYKPKLSQDTPSETALEEPETVSSEPGKFEMDVNLKKEDISIKSLTQLFGERYMECECRPRRFLLDFTRSVREVPHWLHWPVIYKYRSSRRGRSYRTILKKDRQDVKTAGYLVLEEKQDGRFSLGLETDAKIDVQMLKRRLAVPDVSPKQITETLCDVLSKNIEKKVIAKYADIVARQSGKAFKILRNKLNWPEADSYFPNPFPEVPNMSERERPPTEELDIPECCNICFADIDVTSSDSRGLALNKCGHWFCIACWKNHVTACAKNGSTKIMCPEFECKVRVDEGTLISLLTLDDLRVYRSRMDDITISTSGSKLYCPRPGCERIVSLYEESRETGCVSCKCGAEFCIKCLGHAHWPADCCHLRRYQENQRRYGDEDVMSWDIGAKSVMKGKRCPECNYFIEKNQGCPMMSCVCGHEFCWQCMKPANGHGYSPDCYAKSDNSGTKNIQEVFIEDLNKHPQSRSRTYIIALTRRHRQNHRQREMLERFVPKMKKELQRLVGRQILLNKRGVVPTTKKTTHLEEMCHLLVEVETREGMHLLDWGLALISELHHVIEYSAVLIDIHHDDHRLGNTGKLASTLVFLVERMEEVYQLGLHQDMSSVPAKLMKHANIAVEILSRLKALTKYYPKDLDA